MLQKDVMVKDPAGLHLRVAAELVAITRSHASQVQLFCSDNCANCPKANACSILDLISLGAAEGTALTVIVDGPDEFEVINEISCYFEKGAGI